MKDKSWLWLNSFSHNSSLARMGHGINAYQRVILPKTAKLSLSSCQEYNRALQNWSSSRIAKRLKKTLGEPLITFDLYCLCNNVIFKSLQPLGKQLFSTPSAVPPLRTRSLFNARAIESPDVDAGKQENSCKETVNGNGADAAITPNMEKRRRDVSSTD